MRCNFKNWIIGGLFNLFLMMVCYLMLFATGGTLLVSYEELLTFIIPIQIGYCFVIGGLGIFFINLLFYD